MAADRKLDIIGICDHNSAENVEATIRAADNVGNLRVFGGMEITTAEEVHIVGLFEKVQSVLQLQQTIYANLPPGENDVTVFGEQIIVNESDEINGYNNKLLIGATNLSLSEVVEKIHQQGGIAIASHVEREAFSIMSQLGFIPIGLPIDAIELSQSRNISLMMKTSGIDKYPLLVSSDAHSLKEIGQSITEFEIAEATITEIKKAFSSTEGRKITIRA